jgi:alpha-glucosidase (family GH31 glycosyl hydrolase)
VSNYVSAKFPLEAVYMQQDSWDTKKDFTLNTDKINDVNALKTFLSAKNVRLVAYIDSAVNVKDRNANPTYLAGKTVDGFIKSTLNPKNPDGYIVNGKNGYPVVYPDWLNDQCINFWSAQVAQYQVNVPFDGLWTTENEPFGVDSGEVKIVSSDDKFTFVDSPDQNVETPANDNQTYDQSWFFSFWPLTENSTYKLPFIPQFKQVGNYDLQSLSLNATHKLGTN